MRKLIDNVKQRLAAFMEQRDDVALVVRSVEVECAHVLKILTAFDEGESPDFFWMFSENFESPDAYVATIIELFAAKHDAVRKLMEENGDEPWPEVPATVYDENRTPLARLREVMQFSRSLLPAPEGHLAVWVFCPLQILNSLAYAQFVQALIEHDVASPWCHHIRMIIRDNKEAPALSRVLENAIRVQVYEVDLGNDAVTQSFEDEVNDEETPLPLRLQALLVLAGMDYSHQRYGDALKKYKLLNRYYQAAGQKSLQALVLNGMGEVYARIDRESEAQQHFEAALTPAIEAESNPVLLNVTLNLANLKLKQRQWAEAEVYYDAGEKLATAQIIAQTKIQCMENKGYCQAEQGRYGEAVATWNQAATLARNLKEPTLLKPVLHRLETLYKRGRMHNEHREVSREIAALAA